MSSPCNLAALASRGLRAGSLLKDVKWISGPQFLVLPEEEWPMNLDVLQEPPGQEDREVKTCILANAVCVTEDTDTVIQLIKNTSSWNHLWKRVMRVIESYIPFLKGNGIQRNFAASKRGRM